MMSDIVILSTDDYYLWSVSSVNYPTLLRYRSVEGGASVLLHRTFCFCDSICKWYVRMTRTHSDTSLHRRSESDCPSPT